MIKCSKCLKVKEDDQYYDQRKNKSGKQSRCKACVRQAQILYQPIHNEKRRKKYKEDEEYRLKIKMSIINSQKRAEKKAVPTPP